MIRAMKSEWIKIHTTRGNIVLAVLAVVLPLLIGLPIAIFADFDNQTARDIYPNTVLGPATICVLLSGVLGVLCIGQEYRHSTIRTTFAAMPRRSQVLAAKVVLTALMGAALGVLTVVVGSVAMKIVLAIRNVESSISEPGENLTATVGLIVFCALFALFGFALGAIIRQPAGAIPTLLLWPLLIENLTAGVLSIWFDNATKYLPFQSGFELYQPTRSDFGDAFSRPVAALYVAAWATVLVGLGWLSVERRDA